MSQRTRLVLVLAVILGVPAAAVACVWDYDTLKMERSRFPSALELITGKFLRHSKEFYAWRIQDRLVKLAAEPSNVAYYDDLAVAYEKTGQHARALETILAKEKIRPGLYETYSNLGTFHILAGDFEAGLPFIDKALAINPEAHFGRERYQKWLVEYALSRRRNGMLQFPLRVDPEDVKSDNLTGGFDKFLSRRQNRDLSEEEAQQAVKGVLGMMRFANHDNPLLLEALGDLLSFHSIQDAKRMAARCYLKASYEVNDLPTRQRYRSLAEYVLTMQRPHPGSTGRLLLADLEADFAAELADADEWYAKLRDKELAWLRDGKDADAEFTRLYSNEPEALDVTARGTWVVRVGGLVLLGLGLVAVFLVGIKVSPWLRRLKGRPD